jgi:uncharacterized protein YndB with AHSA1/START domain
VPRDITTEASITIAAPVATVWEALTSPELRVSLGRKPWTM